MVVHMQMEVGFATVKLTVFVKQKINVSEYGLLQEKKPTPESTWFYCHGSLSQRQVQVVGHVSNLLGCSLGLVGLRALLYIGFFVDELGK